MSRKSERGPGDASSAASGVRLDKFLKNVGIVPRRALAQEACRRGLIELDGKPVKPSAQVRPGQKLTVRLGMRIREYLVHAVPERPVPRKKRSECVELLSEQTIDLAD